MPSYCTVALILCALVVVPVDCERHSEEVLHGDFYGYGYYEYGSFGYNDDDYDINWPVPTPSPQSFSSANPTPSFSTANPTPSNTFGPVDDDVWTFNHYWEGGTNSPTKGVNHSISKLTRPLNRWKLSVYVYQTDFNENDEYVTSIRVNNRMLNSFCNPQKECGGNFYGCMIDYDVTGMVSGGYLNISTTATSAVSSCPHKGYSLYVRYELLDTNSFTSPSPSRVPVPAPTPRYIIKTPIPTFAPSSTRANDDDSAVMKVFVWEGGTNKPEAGVSFAFKDLGGYNMQYLLSVKVYPTNFDAKNEYVNAITVNKRTLSTYCDPGLSCGAQFYKCVDDVDVTDFVRKGSINVTTFATSNVASGGCPYYSNASKLYVEYQLIGIKIFSDDEVDIKAGQGGDDDDGDKYTTILFLGIFSGAGIVICGVCLAAVAFFAFRRRGSGADSRFQSFVDTDMNIPMEPSAPPMYVQPSATAKSSPSENDAVSPLHEPSGVLDSSSSGGYGLVWGGEGKVDADEQTGGGVPIRAAATTVEERAVVVPGRASSSDKTGPMLQSTRKFSCIAISEESV